MKNIQTLSTAELRRMVSTKELDQALFDREIQARKDEQESIRDNEHEMDFFHPMRGKSAMRNLQKGLPRAIR